MVSGIKTRDESRRLTRDSFKVMHHSQNRIGLDVCIMIYTLFSIIFLSLEVNTHIKATRDETLRGSYNIRF